MFLHHRCLWSSFQCYYRKILSNVWWEYAKKPEPGSSQRCLVTGQEGMHMNWNVWNSAWTQKSTFSLWGLLSTGTDCPERLWSLHPWRCWRPDCMWSRANGFSPAWAGRPGLDDLKRPLSSSAIRWFCGIYVLIIKAQCVSTVIWLNV